MSNKSLVIIKHKSFYSFTIDNIMLSLTLIFGRIFKLALMQGRSFPSLLLSGSKEKKKNNNKYHADFRIQSNLYIWFNLIVSIVYKQIYWIGN